jgi:hypothetical protein
MFKRFTTGMVVGYVLGARAGEKRYDQITDLAERAREIPLVERLTDAARTTAMDQGRRALAAIKDRAQWDDPGSEDGRAHYDGRDGRDTGRHGRPDEENTDDNVTDLEEEEPADEYEDDGAGGPDDLDGDEPEDADEMGSDDVDESSGEADEEDDDVEAYDDEFDDGDDEDGGSMRQERAGQARSRRRIGSLAAAARERGRVA